jgi:hypothetical protein
VKKDYGPSEQLGVDPETLFGKAATMLVRDEGDRWRKMISNDEDGETVISKVIWKKRT